MARSCANRRSGIAEATRIRSNNDCDILIARNVGVLRNLRSDRCFMMFLVQYELFNNMNILSNNHEECDVTMSLACSV